MSASTPKTVEGGGVVVVVVDGCVAVDAFFFAFFVLGPPSSQWDMVNAVGNSDRGSVCLSNLLAIYTNKTRRSEYIAK